MHFLSVRRSLKWRKIHYKPIFCNSRSFKVIGIGNPGKLDSSAYYDARQVCVYVTVLLLDWTTVAETARFERGTQIWCTRTEGSLNPGGRALHRWNRRLMSNISYARCPGLSCMVSAQFTLKMCIAA